MGQGLVLLDATLSGEIDHIVDLRHCVGSHTLAESCAHVIRKAIEMRPEFDDELVIDLSHVQQNSWWEYDEIVVRRCDQWRAAFRAIRMAWKRSVRGLRHYSVQATADSNQELPAVYKPNPLWVGRGVAQTVGSAYASTLTFIHLATSSGRDPDDVVAEYRSATEKQQICLPGVRPPA